jgi:phenylpropionate dioxygenase-like ring-hydroxylating dioxygenase large terminal subunit
MKQAPHPISGAIYENIGDGLVRVEFKEKGKFGIFKWDGTWVEGDLTFADLHFLRFIAGPQLAPESDVFWPLLPPVEGESEVTSTKIPGRSGGAAADPTQTAAIVAKYTGDAGTETDQGIRSAGYIDQDFFLDNDRYPDLVPDVFRLKSPLPGGPKKVSTDRFYKKEYHDLEVARLWKKTWQMACREDDIPEIGDYHVYTIANLSYLVVRTAENEFKAHANSCLHRGRQLRDCDGKRATEFRCAFHGWSWKIDGTLREITTEWDFPGVREDAQTLPQAQVATWGGFVFINPDQDAGSLEEFMGPVMIDHYSKLKMENRYKQAHVGRVVKGNWKVVQEAFLEAYHTIATHPQLLLSGGDLADNRYDVFGNWSRMAHVQVSASSPQRGIISTKEKALETFYQTADFFRGYLQTLIGDEVEQFSDSELNDMGFNNLFPNFSPWGGWSRLVYRFRPHGDNPDECFMEAMLLAPWPEGKPKPPAATLHMLGEDEPWVKGPELGTIAAIFDQDCANVPYVQAGLKTNQTGYIWYSAYQESAIRNFHEIYDRKLGLSES